MSAALRIALAAYQAATGHPLRCAGCGNIISADSREPEEIREGIFVHPNPRCDRAAQEADHGSEPA